jgi:hypothetical protein
MHHLLLTRVKQYKTKAAISNKAKDHIGKITQDGRLEFRGAVVYSTNSTGNLSFLDNVVSILKGEGDITTGNFTTTEWELK